MWNNIPFENNYSKWSERKQNFHQTISNERDKVTYTNSLINTTLNRENINETYGWSVSERKFIQEEYEHLLAVLTKQGNNREDFWHYLRYCCLLLAESYKNYGGKKIEVDKYLALAEKYRLRALNQEPLPEEDSTIFEKIQKDCLYFLTTPLHTSRIRDTAGLLNIMRLMLVFCRLTAKTSLVYAQNNGWLQPIEQFMGQPVNHYFLSMGTDVFNFLSVGLFALQLLMNLLMIIKHALTDQHQKNYSESFWQEVYSRYCKILNDLVWTTVNLLTNYAKYFHLSATFANYTLALFLIFDASLLLHRQYLLHAAFNIKQAQYNSEKRLLQQSLLNDLNNRSKHEQLSVLEGQLNELKQTLARENGTLQSNLAAAAIIAIGFSGCFLLNIAAATPLCFFICVIGISFYLSADKYGLYTEQKWILEQQHTEANRQIVQQKINLTRNNFIFSIAKNALAPQIILLACAINLPIGLMLVALYAIYECRNQYVLKPPIPPIELNNDPLIPVSFMA